MNKSLITGLVAVAVVATAGAAVAGYALKHKGPAYAQVVDVQPVQKTIRTPRQECHDEVVTQQAPTKDAKQVTGTVVGVVKKIATGVGASAGSHADDRIQKRMQDGRTVATTEKRCVTVYDTHIERNGYDVRYRIGETEGTVRMDHDPGDRIPLRQGQLVLDARTATG
jgi:uncharacterized protein YcfJ